MNISLMTYNLRTCLAQDGDNAWEYRYDKVAAMIREHSPLLLGTQEGNTSMLEDLQLEEYHWIGEDRLGDRGDEHCAIYFKKDELDVVEHGTFWLSEQPEIPASISWDSSLPRICTWGHFRHKGTGTELLLFNTHLDHQGQQAREQGVRLIWERIKELRAAKEIPVLLTGDFNSQPDSMVIRFMRGEPVWDEALVDMSDAYSMMVGPVGASFHDNYTGRIEGEPIDYIFVTPDVQVSSIQIDRRRIDGRYPSDHYPVVAHLIAIEGG
ncbi:endonuclease/exonuclease/phosphatase family protein [Paenibacillus planticolens]|uniref:Endonuclease n=1 Tax=Paenibacillus planticolens TaxID=2654976 RepID=A0ABX1ZXP3_9BACL|nr:endonuclease/exonuclease/phosphatase family protein [Paenibacillus planticolens]NOV03830.1 endonuclease [Paenibacillus planticolens]